MYLKKISDYMLVYKTVDRLEIIDCTSSDFTRCLYNLRNIFNFILTLVGVQYLVRVRSGILQHFQL